MVVGTTDDRFFVPLPYGSDVDWCRNAFAAEGRAIAWQGGAYRAESPTLVELDAGKDAFPGWLHRLVRSAGAEHYLRLERDREVPDVYRSITDAHPIGPAALATGALLLAAILWRAGRRA